MMNVSVYVPVYNSAAYLDRVIQALLNQTVAFKEILIVDDGSIDDSSRIAKKYPVSIISHNCNKGLGLVRNTGIYQCQYDFIASIDSDCVLDKDWLETCISFFDDPQVAGVGGKLIENNNHHLPNKWRAVNLIQHFGDEIKMVPFLSGSNTVYRKSDLYEAGLYNPCYMRNYEDVDLSKRIAASGKKLMYVPRAKVAHIRHDTVYSVMRSCWGFRHMTYPKNSICLIRDIAIECKHALSIIFKNIRHARFSLLLIDSVYIFFQCYFCVKAYRVKNNNFK